MFFLPVFTHISFFYFLFTYQFCCWYYYYHHYYYYHYCILFLFSFRSLLLSLLVLFELIYLFLTIVLLLSLSILSPLSFLLLMLLSLIQYLFLPNFQQEQSSVSMRWVVRLFLIHSVFFISGPPFGVEALRQYYRLISFNYSGMKERDVSLIADVIRTVLWLIVSHVIIKK